MKKILPFLISFGFTITSLPAQAENLLEVYDQALQNNPDLRKSYAERQIAYSAVKESMGTLFPQIGLAGSVGKIYGSHGASGNNSNTRAVTATMSQVLFNMTVWKQLNIAQKQAAIADISYRGQQQALILNTAVAYFDVIKSIDILKAVQAQKKAIGTQLDQTRQRYKVGLLPIMDVQNTQAQYDQTVAQEYAAKNKLQNALEVLRQVTGIHYTELASISKKIAQDPLAQNIDDLLVRANKNNVSLLAAYTAVELANDQIKLANSAHLPTLSLDVNAALTKNSISPANQNAISYTNTANQTVGAHSIAATLSIPIFNGGRIMQKAKQAQYNYDSYQQQLESAKRTVEKDVRSSYNNIVASLSAIKAYEQTVVSAESSLNATRSSYNVGARTIVDVLNATTALYNAKQLLAESQFNYLTSLLSLKGALGELERTDLEYLNEMLTQNVSTIYAM